MDVKKYRHYEDVFVVRNKNTINLKYIPATGLYKISEGSRNVGLSLLRFGSEGSVY